MNNPFELATRELQDRIRDLAYGMWESAGRQQGMAIEYWLAAEREVMNTFQAAAEKLMPTNLSFSTAVDVEPFEQPTAELVADPLPIAAPAAAVVAEAVTAPVDVAPNPVEAAGTGKPARRSPSRGKAKS